MRLGLRQREQHRETETGRETERIGEEGKEGGRSNTNINRMSLVFGNFDFEKS